LVDDLQRFMLNWAKSFCCHVIIYW
jgi:hypothetical protein